LATFLTIQTSIADYLNRTDLTSQIQTAINRAISSYSTKDFWFTQATATFPTIAAQEAYAVSDGIPSDLREITYLKMAVGTSNYRMKMRSIQFIEDRNINNTTGRPSDFAFWAQKIYLNPIPSGIFTMTIYYRKNYVALSAGGDTNDFTNTAEALNLIEAKALWWLNTYIIRDPIGAKENLEMESSALSVLENISNNIQNSEENNPTDF
jgi:hypothetical protein